MGNTLRPIHKAFVGFGSSSTHSSTFSCYASSLKGYDNTFNSFSLNSTHSTSDSAGWQYIDRLVTFIIKQFEELVSAVDSEEVTHIKYIEEIVSSFDGLFDGVVDVEEAISIVDQWIITHIKYFDEIISSSDVLLKSLSAEEIIALREDWMITHIKSFVETVSSADSGDGYILVDVIDSMKLEISGLMDVTDTMVVENSGALDVTDSMNIGVIPMTLVGVTSASGTVIATPLTPINIDPFDPSPTHIPTPGLVSLATSVNPFEPTIIVDGVVYSLHPSTDPGAYSAGTTFIQWLDYDIEAAD